MKSTVFPLLAAMSLLAPAALPLRAQDAPKPAAAAAANLLPDDAEAAWKEVEKALTPPPPPKEWNEKAPSQEELTQFRANMGKMAGVSADKAREFYTRFPKHEKAATAKDHERRMLTAAVNLGAKEREAQLKAAGGPPEPENRGPQDELQKKLQEAAQSAMKKQSEGLPAVFAEFEKGVRALQKDNPDRPEIYAALLEIAEGLPAEKALAIAKEIEAAKTEPAMKEQAAGIRKKLERVGKPVAMAFTSTDGRKIDLLEMKGKVILVDFWATWCGPCVKEIPNVKAAYAKLHDKGFEIVGISFDEDKEALTKFVKNKEMPWVQYFDGEGWGNKFGKEFGIQSIPSMWLIDKQGNLRDLNAREDLVGKVEKLLAEK